MPAFRHPDDRPVHSRAVRPARRSPAVHSRRGHAPRRRGASARRPGCLHRGAAERGRPGRGIEAALGQDKGAAAASATPAPASSGGIEVSSSSVRVGANNQWLDLSFVLDMALAAFSSDEPLQKGGHNPTTNGFTLQQLEFASAARSTRTSASTATSSSRSGGRDRGGLRHHARAARQPAAARRPVPHPLRPHQRHPPARLGLRRPAVRDRPRVRRRGQPRPRRRGCRGSRPLPWYVELVGSVTDAAGEGTARSFFGGRGPGGRVARSTSSSPWRVKQFFPLSPTTVAAVGPVGAPPGPTPPATTTAATSTAPTSTCKYRPITRRQRHHRVAAGRVLYRAPAGARTTCSRDHGGYAHAVLALRAALGRGRALRVRHAGVRPATARRRRLPGSRVDRPPPARLRQRHLLAHRVLAPAPAGRRRPRRLARRARSTPPSSPSRSSSAPTAPTPSRSLSMETSIDSPPSRP